MTSRLRSSGRPIMDQVWGDLVFLHWRVEPAAVAPYLPPGCRPDVHDGSSWIGLIGFEMREAGFGYGHPVPYFGDFGEINVRLYSPTSGVGGGSSSARWRPSGSP